VEGRGRIGWRRKGRRREKEGRGGKGRREEK
jgi:hypothetical protein